jgi:CRP-like cAMP-binding protein
MSELLEEYGETLTRIEHLVFSDAYRRVLSVFIYLAKHFGVDVNGKRVVKHWFRHQDIATLVGVARETASNEINKLEEKGFIKYVNHKIIFADISELEDELYSIES